MASARSLLFPLALLAFGAQAAEDFFCCQDPATGRRICGDLLPVQCRGQAYQAFDRAGNLSREVGPPLTREQKAEQAAEAQRRGKQEAASRELRRKDQALLDTYAAPEDIDIAQQKMEGDVQLAIRNAEASLEAAKEKRRKLDAEAEFYLKKTMPGELQRDLRASDHELRTQQELLDMKRAELAAVRAKYDIDRKRYFELTGRSSSGASAPASAVNPPPASSSTTR